MEYKILSGQSYTLLMDQVMSAIYWGWKPLGGVACRNDGFFQAMVKE